MTEPTPNCCVCGIPSIYCSAHERLTIAETLKALRMSRKSRKSFYALVEAGKLHPKKIGPSSNGRVLVARAEVEALLA